MRERFCEYDFTRFASYRDDDNNITHKSQLRTLCFCIIEFNLMAVPVIKFPIFFVVRIIGIIVAALVLSWTLHYRGGYALISDNKDLIFNVIILFSSLVPFPNFYFSLYQTRKMPPFCYLIPESVESVFMYYIVLYNNNNTHMPYFSCISDGGDDMLYASAVVGGLYIVHLC